MIFLLSFIFSKSTFSIEYGKRTAKCELINFFDLGCEHCTDFFKNIFPVIKKRWINTGKIRLVYTPYPIHGETLVLMANCANLPASERKILFETLMECASPSTAVIKKCMSVLKRPYTEPTPEVLKYALSITKKHSFDSLPVIFINQSQLTPEDQDNIIEYLELK